MTEYVCGRRVFGRRVFHGEERPGGTSNFSDDGISAGNRSVSKKEWGGIGT